MFDKKVESLFANNNTNKNLFIEEALKTSAETLSGNGALKYSTSGDVFVDDFANIANYKSPRNFQEVSETMQKLWSIDPINTIKLSIYIRMITRKCQVINLDEVKKTEEVQHGQGLKNEGIMRMLWLAINQPEYFKCNFPIYIAAGSWRDVFVMLNMDLQYHGWDNRKLDWNFFRYVIKAGLINPNSSELVRKYLPTIRTNSKCKTLESQADTIIGRWLARFLFVTNDKATSFKQYRKLKSSGDAHVWQQQISQQLFNEIEFDKIAGRALNLLVNSKFLKNHNLSDKYTEWINSKDNVKYTGFVFELFKPIDNSHLSMPEDYIISTINAQFNQLVQTGKKDTNVDSNLLVVRDVSGSMGCKAIGCNMTSYDIAKAMALYFSEFLKGEFANSYAVFSGECKLVNWKGNTPVEKWINSNEDIIGNTNFQKVIDMFVKLKQKGVPESDFPGGILCVSDGEFDCCERGCKGSTVTTTNFNEALTKLKNSGFSDDYVNKFRIILWDIPNMYYGHSEMKFEDFADAPNFYYMSGYDPSVISFLMAGGEFKSTPKNAKELFEVTMDQELLNLVHI